MNLTKYIDMRMLLALNYKKIGLTDDEYLVASITYALIESGTKFINPSDLALLCNFSTTKIDVVYSGLINKKLISNEFDNTGSIYTSFNGLNKKLLELIKDDLLGNSEKVKETKVEDIASFMQEFFNRPLSPLEYDVIQSWKNKKYAIELIKASCEIAARSGNKSIRYIDTIIFEENRKQELGTEEYQRRQQETIELSTVDWLNK